MMSTTKDLKDDIEFSPSDNPLRYMLNNYTVNLRIKFYDVLFQNFKKFAKNKYIDNLSYAMFFIEICSLPFAVNKGENGEMLYNIFSNVTYAIKKKTKIFKAFFLSTTQFSGGFVNCRINLFDFIFVYAAECNAQSRRID